MMSRAEALSKLQRHVLHDSQPDPVLASLPDPSLGAQMVPRGSSEEVSHVPWLESPGVTDSGFGGRAGSHSPPAGSGGLSG